jgi:hypothetical protein
MTKESQTKLTKSLLKSAVEKIRRQAIETVKRKDNSNKEK